MHADEVEIGPGRYLTVRRSDRGIDDAPKGLRARLESLTRAVVAGQGAEWTQLRIPWGGIELSWNSSDIPINPREYGGSLYLIGLDRSKPARIRFRYYGQAADGFREIVREQFPKAIAGQNMWIGWGDKVC